MKVESLTTVVTIANATELSLEVLKKVVGNDVSDSLSGSELNNDTIRQHVITELQNNFSTVTRS